MALNIEKLQNKLKQLESGKKTVDFNRLLWKPKEGSQKIRIVPYRPNGEEQDSPFIELKFYYKFNGIASILAPSTFGKPDPFEERYEALTANGTTEEKELANKHFKSVARTYVPILVRGEEDQGVRFWGFGVTVYKQLLSYCNTEWGDITDLREGNDIEVRFTEKGQKIDKKTGKPFPETNIIPSPKKTLAVSPTNKEAMESIRKQLDITQVFPLKTYEELDAIIESYLTPEGQEPSSSEVEKASATIDKKDVVETATPVPSAAEEEDFEKFFAKSS